MFKRHRSHSILQASSSSSDEEDAFTALSNKKKPRTSIEPKPPPKNNAGAAPPVSKSSAKRHHHTSTERQAKMDALLEELAQAEKEVCRFKSTEMATTTNHSMKIPEKKGSFVEEGEEHLTTNIFVGNLAPSVTEEQLTDLFRQFGDLYSVKIMWPRTAEERARNRNTGFVCFMNRDDAEEAMDAFNDVDPFRCGRQMVLRWGKNVKKTVKRGTGGVPIPPIRKRQRGEPVEEGVLQDKRPEEEPTTEPEVVLKAAAPIELPIYNPEKHERNSIYVIQPTDPQRFKLISVVASFVARDGSIFERKLIEKEARNSTFSFLRPPSGDTAQEEERIFYRWRVYSFAQGDGFNSWRTEPFMMFYPNGQWWIPPPLLNVEAARLEQMQKKQKEQEIAMQIRERRKIAEKKDFMTGRQLEHAKFGAAPVDATPAKLSASSTDSKLNDWDRQRFRTLAENLTISKQSICEAMAFCFDKSGAAIEISSMLHALLLRSECSIDTRIARLYLLSDVLFNSQQPGVRNAFRYRDAIQNMAPSIFMSLGKHPVPGRITLNKLRNAAHAVLSAWNNWSVYVPQFIDDLYDCFDGTNASTKAKDAAFNADSGKKVKDTDAEKQRPVANKPQGRWIDDAGDVDGEELSDEVDGERLAPDEVDGEALDDVDGEALEDDVDGEALDDDVDGEALEDDVDGEALDDDVDGEALDNDVDGEALEEEGEGQDTKEEEPQPIINKPRGQWIEDTVEPDDVDGEQLAPDDVDGEQLAPDDVDGEALDEDVDGEALDEDVDGEAMDDVDGEALGEDVDGEALDEDVDGEALEDIDGEAMDEKIVEEQKTKIEEQPQPIIHKPRGNWEEATVDVNDKKLSSNDIDGEHLSSNVDGEQLSTKDVDGEALDEDVDGEALDEDVDGEAFDEDVDGEAFDEDVDGEPFDEDVDREAFDEDVDGEPLDKKEVERGQVTKTEEQPQPIINKPRGNWEEATGDIDGEKLSTNDVDGEALDEDVDGEAFDEDVDGEAFDEDVDGEAFDEDVDGEAFDEDVDGEAMSDPDM